MRVTGEALALPWVKSRLLQRAITAEDLPLEPVPEV